MPLTPPAYVHELLQGRFPAEPPPSDPLWGELIQELRAADTSERHEIVSEWVRSSNGDGDVIMAALVDIQRQNRELSVHNLGRLVNARELLQEDVGELPVLVGSQSNALFVRGEGHFIVGPAGVGKTILTLNMSFQMARMENVLGYMTCDNLNILVLQAELPRRFLRYRLNRMTEAYHCAGGISIDDFVERIHVFLLNSPIDLTKAENRQYILRTAQSVSADVIIIDPFLPFFSGDENSNAEVRNLLDAIKYEIAEPCSCALIITDHISKSDPGDGARARGASAKIDWAASVINLSPHRTPQGQCGKFISAKITKMRYGWNNEEPIILRLDSGTLTFSILNPDLNGSIETIRQIIMEAGGEVMSQHIMLRDIRNRLGVGDRRARAILGDAIQRNILQTSQGRNRSTVYRLVSCHEENNESNDNNNQ